MRAIARALRWLSKAFGRMAERIDPTPALPAIAAPPVIAEFGPQTAMVHRTLATIYLARALQQHQPEPTVGQA